MAAPGIGNPAGAQELDSFDPKVLTFTAVTNISGGALVWASGATANSIGSGTPQVTSTALTAITDASGGNFTGIALTSALSGAPVPVAVEGVFILQANGAVVAGNGVNCDGNNAALPAGSETITAYTTSKLIGRALTSAASGGFTAVYLRG